MKHNLMGKEKIENLGFDQVNSWDNEEMVSRKKPLLYEKMMTDPLANITLFLFVL